LLSVGQSGLFYFFFYRKCPTLYLPICSIEIDEASICTV
jgi:hypothetical protein